MSDQKDILSFEQGGKGKIPDDKLMAYLEGRLSPEEQYEVEEWLSVDGMESDALEGLKKMQPEDARKAVGKINYELRKQLRARTKRRTNYIKENQWALLSILIVLMLAVVCYIAFRTITGK